MFDSRFIWWEVEFMEACVRDAKDINNFHWQNFIDFGKIVFKRPCKMRISFQNSTQKRSKYFFKSPETKSKWM